jgi:hypothetical protein
MIDIEELKPQILKALMPLKPDKIILFGSLLMVLQMKIVI